MATVVVLNGTSSSGKTTIARAFQDRAPRRFLNFSIDNILYSLPPRDLQRIMRGDDVSDLPLSELIRAFYSCVRQLLDLGHDLVIDHAVSARYHAELLVEAVSSHSAVLIGLNPPIEIVREREEQRGDRRPGLAGQQQKTIHRWLDYDLMIDTSEISAEEAADRVVDLLGSGTRTAFERTRRKLLSGAES